MSDDEFRQAQLKVRDHLMRLTLWKARQMRDKYVGRPRTYRLAKEYRALKSLLLDTGGARPPGGASAGRKRRPLKN